MAELKALIVAAGRGIRMGPSGEMRPKGLLEIDGVPLVRRSVELLQKRGIETVRIVTGYLSEQYEAIFADIKGVELIHNPEFSSTGSLRSLATGLAGLRGPFVLLESDLIYEARSLEPVSTSQSKIVVSGDTGAGDEVYVWARNIAGNSPVFVTMSKDINAHQGAHFGELTGISCFTAGDTEALKRATLETLLENPKSDYEPAVVHMAQSRDITCHHMADLAWAEIDDEDMYAHAVETVWPIIQRRDAGFR